ncbi:NUDIX domain-containing protein [Palleronia sp.]|uniref:NUDIX domain-containing protein n=1 Tax=Palleronia sp. TaxID=1940284 RepID=UPI0035C7F2E6
MSVKDRIRLHEVEILSDAHYTLRRARFAWRGRDGRWQDRTRESFDRGDSCAALLYDPARETVILVRQFRWSAYENGHDGLLLEVPAGLLEGANPANRMRAEIEEETGYRVAKVDFLYDVFTSPGAVTERVHCFAARYIPDDWTGPGGGLSSESEDIEVVELSLTEALDMVQRGEIRDAKTVMLLQHARLALMPAAT